MKSRIQSVEQLKQIASAKLKEEIALQKENAELKRLLRAAIRTIDYCGKQCEDCMHEEPAIYEKCTWRLKYAAEAEKLLRGESDDKS